MVGNKDIKIKSGMAGSRCGKGRRLGTEILKKQSKKLRRKAGKLEARRYSS